MSARIEVECPHCHHRLHIDRITGELLEVLAPVSETGSGDRLADGLKKIKDDRDAAEQKFEAAKAAEKNKAQELDALFHKSLEQVKKEGPVTREVRDLDLD